jgi:tetratricopeptide (TPR) repeat protein
MSRLTQLEKLHAADPNDADVAYMLAHEHAKAGNTPTAVHWFDTCLKLDPGYHYAFFHKAKALSAAGEVEGALDALRDGLARATKDGNGKAISEISALMMELEA